MSRNAHMGKFWPNWLRWGLLAALLCAISNYGYTAQAEGPLAVPKKWTTEELQQKAAEYFSAFEDGSATMLDTVLDPELHAQWFNLDVQISMAIDDGRPLGLEGYGLTLEGNGSYDINYQEFPQWKTFGHRVNYFFSSPEATLKEFEALRQRGFRDSDLEIVKAYLLEHNLDKELSNAYMPDLEAFQRKSKKS